MSGGIVVWLYVALGFAGGAAVGWRVASKMSWYIVDAIDRDGYERGYEDGWNHVLHEKHRHER
jgi:hypothetical protein